jgi:hypothetical protein
MTTFPTTEAAASTFADAFAADAAIPYPDINSSYEYRAAWRRASNNKDAARSAMVETYGSELLPAILGGEWKLTKRELVVRMRSQEVWWPCCSPLFDHPLNFRLRSRGALTWKNCAAIGHPYILYDNIERTSLDKRMLLKAEGLARRFGIGIWARPDLSAWYPGRTSLVIAALGLAPARAAEFGFIALS